MSQLLKIKATIIGETVINHTISVIGSDTDLNKTAEEFLKRQYPNKIDKICDIETKLTSKKQNRR